MRCILWCAVYATRAVWAAGPPRRWSHTVLIDRDGTAFVSGCNDHGQLGLGDTHDRSAPEPVLQDVQGYALGASHTLLLKKDGSVYATGRNHHGALGDGTTEDRWRPVLVATDAQSVAAGDAHSVVLLKDGAVLTMGRNGNGQLGDGTGIDHALPAPIFSGARAIAAGWLHTVVLDTDGTAYAMGSNGFAQLGDRTVEGKLAPVKIEVDEQIKSVLASGFTTSLVGISGKVHALGMLDWIGNIGAPPGVDTWRWR